MGNEAVNWDGLRTKWKSVGWNFKTGDQFC